jgi:hypothetical protein
MAKAMQKGPTTFTAPRWAGHFVTPRDLMPAGGKLLASAFAIEADVVVDVAVAGAAAGATSVPVTALSGPIPNNTRLDFGTKGVVVLAANAATGAVVLTTEPIPFALVDADVTTYQGTNTKTVPSGTFVGRTIAERDAETLYGPADAADDEIFIVAFEIADLDDNNDAEFVLPYTPIVLYENYLPVWANLAAGLKTAIRLRWRTALGRD